MAAENIKIRQFLLGNATESDDREISRRILAGGDLDEPLEFAEEALIEDYLGDRLTTEEARLFHENFLTSPARIELFEEISQLRTYARKNFVAAAEKAAEEKKPDGFLANLFSINFLRPIAAFALILVIGAVVWRVYYSGESLTETEKTYAVLNAKDLSSPASMTGGVQTKSLIYGTFRSTEGAAKLAAASLTGDVLFRLALPPNASSDGVFDLKLSRGEQTVFRQINLRAYQNPDGRELKVLLPKSVLPVGSYQITLNTGDVYNFTVE